MKIIIKTLLLVFATNVALGQTIRIKEPEFANNGIYVNDTIGDGIPLEKQKYTISTKSNAALYIPFANLAAGKTKTKLVFQGKESTTKISSKEKIHFIIKMTDNSNDPTSLIEVFKLTQEKNLRTSIMAEAKVIGGAETKNLETFTYSAKKYGQSSYLIELNNLPVGQYGIHMSTSVEYLLFEIN
ncbi:MAG: hypothetical protein HOO91_13010 [Bacteroidales bacterium]|nr:hypothetical protein [Bacteroidales bacterium]